MAQVQGSGKKLTVLDLFSGIGGFSLGLERTGKFQTIQFCEINNFCRKILAKHWPNIPIHDDIRTFQATPGEYDIVAGGFPCQDISLAGRAVGLSGERSGLFFEMIRIISESRPKLAIIENVASLTYVRKNNDFETVLQKLHEIGYNAEWHCITAAAVGAPHRRDRVWIIAYPNSDRLRWGDNSQSRIIEEFNFSARSRRWPTEPGICRVANGVPNRVDRVKSLGNAVVPQVVEFIGNNVYDWLVKTGKI